jgi:hypothetical protein
MAVEWGMFREEGFTAAPSAWKFGGFVEVESMIRCKE